MNIPLAVSASLPLLAFALAAGAEDAARADKPTWHCLPAETVLTIRIPDGNACAAAFTRTRFGRLCTDQERIDGIVETVMAKDPAQLEQMKKGLAELGFAPADAARLWAGEAGFALAFVPDHDKPADSDPLLLFWMEPEQELAQRVPGLIDRLIEKQDGPAEGRMQRVDEKLGDFDVVHLIIPDPHTETSGKEFEDEAFEDGQMPEAKKFVTYGPPTHLLFHRRGTRLLLAVSPAKTDLEAGKGVFARFLAAHDADGDGGFASVVTAVPGVVAAAPRGAPMMEILANFAPLWQRLALKIADPGSEITGEKFLEHSCLRQLSAATMAWTMDGDLMRTRAFVASPEPRGGIPAMMHQPQLPAEPKPWVPAGIVDYFQIGFDAAGLYARIKELTVALGGDDQEQTFAMIEAQASAFLGVGLDTMLAGLGHRVVYCTFPLADAAAAPDALETDRLAVVWEIVDEPAWQKVFAAIGNAAAMTGGAYAPAQEQGFSGFRLNPNGQASVPDGGFFLGQGHLVIGIGKGVVEEVLAALRSPPAGEAALVGSPLVRRAHDLLPARASSFWSVQDVGATIDKLTTQLDKLAGLAPPDEAETFEDLIDLMPSSDQLHDALGLSTGQMWSSPQGLEMESVMELPLADEPQEKKAEAVPETVP